MTKLWGKYRGKVLGTNVDDLGRIEVNVPSKFGERGRALAMPCVPYAGDGVGFFVIPPEGANVWIEFEDGDPNYPIWTGCFWTEGEELPVNPATAEKKVLKTGVGTITLNDSEDSGGITIETKDNMKIVIDKNGIEITNNQGRIELSGSKVSINGDALEVQ